MSGTAVRNLAFLALALLLGWALPARADDLSRFNELNKIKSQKLVAEVNAALARDLDPRQAVEKLRRVKAQLEDDVTFPERQRAQFLQQVQNRLAVVVQEARKKEAAEEEIAAQKAAAKIKKEQRQDAELQGKKPAAVDLASKTISAAGDKLDASARLKFVRERGYDKMLREVEISAANIEEQRITERYMKAKERSLPNLTSSEKKIIKALNSTLSIDYNGTKFKDVIADLNEKLDVPIFVDEPSLKEADVDYENSDVTFKVKKIQMRTILRKILGDKGLSYIVKGGAIQVVTAQKARETMVVRSYGIGDLVAPDPRYGIWGRPMMLMNVQSLMNIIQSASGDPAMWQQGGASINFFEPNMQLIIRAPAEVHYMLPQTFGR